MVSHIFYFSNEDYTVNKSISADFLICILFAFLLYFYNSFIFQVNYITNSHRE